MPRKRPAPASAPRRTEGAEVLVLGPADPEDVAFRRTLDMMVEYGIYVESDGKDRLPTRLPADLSQYKAIVVDEALPLAEDLRRAPEDVRRRVLFYHKPAQLNWNDERPMYILVHALLMRHGVMPQNPLFLRRNAARRDEDLILGQAFACIEQEPGWLRVGNDVSHTWCEGLWAAARLYRRDNLKKHVLQIIEDMLDRDRGAADPKERYRHPIYNNPCLLLPMWKETGIRRYRDAALLKMPTLAEARRQARAWRRGTPYLRCENLCGAPWTWAMRAAYCREPEFFQPAVDVMVAGFGALFDRRKRLFAHYGIKGGRQGLTWGRGQGWALYGLVGLLEFLPRDHPEFPTIRSWLDMECEGLRETQDPVTGLWNHVLGERSTRLEVSGTAMTTRHIARAWRLGLVRLDFVPDMLARAWHGIKAHTFQHRTCTFAYGTGEGYDLQFYATVPCGGSLAYTFIAGAEYVTTFGPLVK